MRAAFGAERHAPPGAREGARRPATASSAAERRPAVDARRDLRLLAFAVGVSAAGDFIALITLSLQGPRPDRERVRGVGAVRRDDAADRRARAARRPARGPHREHARAARRVRRAGGRRAALAFVRPLAGDPRADRAADRRRRDRAARRVRARARRGRPGPARGGERADGGRALRGLHRGAAAGGRARRARRHAARAARQRRELRGRRARRGRAAHAPPAAARTRPGTRTAPPGCARCSATACCGRSCWRPSARCCSSPPR